MNLLAEYGLLTDEEQKAYEDLTEAELHRVKLREANWQSVLESEAGRMVLAELLAYSGFQRSAFTGQTNQTIFNTGSQRVGQHIFESAIQIDEGLFIQLIRTRFYDR